MSTMTLKSHSPCGASSYLTLHQAGWTKDFDTTDSSDTVWSHTGLLQEVLQHNNGLRLKAGGKSQQMFKRNAALKSKYTFSFFSEKDDALRVFQQVM